MSKSPPGCVVVTDESAPANLKSWAVRVSEARLALRSALASLQLNCSTDEAMEVIGKTIGRAMALAPVGSPLVPEFKPPEPYPLAQAEDAFAKLIATFPAETRPKKPRRTARRWAAFVDSDRTSFRGKESAIEPGIVIALLATLRRLGMDFGYSHSHWPEEDRSGGVGGPKLRALVAAVDMLLAVANRPTVKTEAIFNIALTAERREAIGRNTARQKAAERGIDFDDPDSVITHAYEIALLISEERAAYKMSSKGGPR
jgi:hypothetical protein